MSRQRRLPARGSPAVTVLACAACAAFAACAAGPDDGSNGALASARRLAALEFGPGATNRWQRNVDRMLATPGAELLRARSLAAAILGLPAAGAGRTMALPARIGEFAAAEGRRSSDAVQAVPPLLRQVGDPNRFAATTARDLERAGFLLGLERRPLGEIDDREHRTDPDDDRPEKTFWQRLWRRVFP